MDNTTDLPVPVLLVDDDADIRDSFGEALIEEGYAVATVATAASALTYLRAATVGHVVLLDYLMPGGKGIVLLHALAQESLLQRHRYVLMTAFSPTSLPPGEQHIIARSCAAIVQKPLDIERLLATVERTAAQMPRTWAPPDHLLSDVCDVGVPG